MSEPLRLINLGYVNTWVLHQIRCTPLTGHAPCMTPYRARDEEGVWRPELLCRLREGHPSDCRLANERYAFVTARAGLAPMNNLIGLAYLIKDHGLVPCSEPHRECEVEQAVWAIVTRLGTW